MHESLVRHGHVLNVEDYLNSSVRDYAGKIGLVNLNMR